MSVFVTDTHPLVWYAGGKHSLLSKKALKAFESAENGTSFLHVPAVVLWEAAILEKTGKIKISDNFVQDWKILELFCSNSILLFGALRLLPDSVITSWLFAFAAGC